MTTFDRMNTLQDMVDDRYEEAMNYLYALIDHVRKVDGDCEELRRLCLLELIREDDDTIGPDDIENTYGDMYETPTGDYLVLTEVEADSAWDDELENYIDECILPGIDGVASHYFDRESWKRDARYDGRGHALAVYDGNERYAREYVVFRVN